MEAILGDNRGNGDIHVARHVSYWILSAYGGFSDAHITSWPLRRSWHLSNGPEVILLDVERSGRYSDLFFRDDHNRVT